MNTDVEEVASYATHSSNPLFTPYEYQTTSTSILKFRDAAWASARRLSIALQPYYFHTHLVGSDGSILDNKFHSQKLAGLNRQAWSNLSMKLLDSGDVGDHPYQTQFQAFFDALDEGKDMPLTSFDDAFTSHRVIAAADRSAAEGRPVSFRRSRLTKCLGLKTLSQMGSPKASRVVLPQRTCRRRLLRDAT